MGLVWVSPVIFFSFGSLPDSRSLSSGLIFPPLSQVLPRQRSPGVLSSVGSLGSGK
jgi:hypothetical protein